MFQFNKTSDFRTNFYSTVNKFSHLTVNLFKDNNFIAKESKLHEKNRWLFFLNIQT